MTAAYGAGLWAGLVFLVPAGVGLITLLAGGIAFLTLPRVPAAAAMLAAGIAAGGAAAAVRGSDCTRVWRAGPQAAVLRLHDRPGRRGTTTASVLHSREGCGGTVRVRLDSAVGGGTRILAAGSTSVPVVFRVRRFRVLEGGKAPRFILRDAVGRRVERLYGPRAPLVEALVTGRREDLDRALQRAFAGAGLAHVLAISGMHVGIMAGWCVLVLRLAVPRRVALVLSAGGAWIYVMLLGFPAPASRAAGLLTVFAASRLAQRHPPPGAVLAVSALFVMAVDPLAVVSVGAWLSVAAVWGTDQAARALPEAWRSRAVARLLASSVGATVATAPVTAWVFGSVAPVGVLANLVAVPLAGLAVPAVFASLLVPPMASGAGLALSGIEWVALSASRIPGGHLEGPPGWPLAAVWLAVLLALVWVRYRRPTWVVARRRMLLAGATGSWILAVLPSLDVAPAAGGKGLLEIHVLDVGQGDAIAIRSPEGHWVLIDGGPRTPQFDAGRSVILPFFRRRGVRELDVLIASHGDADHLGGVPAVVRELTPALVLEPGQPLTSDLYLEHLSLVDATGADWRPSRAGDTLRLGQVSLTVVHPTAEWIRTHQEPNENSLVLWLRYGGFDVLFTGDIGWPAESALARSMHPVEVLKVGHHGSAGSTSGQWLSRLQPDLAVISVGRNRYGHPAPAVLDRLDSAGVHVRRTDRGGAVTITSDGSYFWVTQNPSLTLAERARCLSGSWLRSSGSSSSRRSCTAEQPVSFPTSSTTSR